MRNNLILRSRFFRLRFIAALLLCISAVSMTLLSFAASPASESKATVNQNVPKTRSHASKSVTEKQKPSRPSTPSPTDSGTLTPGNPVITYTDGPLDPNPTGVVGLPNCTAPNSCSDFTLTVSASSLAATHNVTILVSWIPVYVDFDVFVENANHTAIVAANQSTADPSAITLPIPADGTVYHIVIEASVGTSTLSGSISLTQKFPTAGQGAGAPARYMNYPAGSAQANGDNEPSLGIDWNPNVASLKHDLVNRGGVAFFTTAAFEEYRVNFDDCSSPAVNLWENITPTLVPTGLDPIGFVDHYSSAPLGLSYPPPQTPGRVFALDLAAGDSAAAYSDNDGNSYLPGGNGGPGQGADHESLGGGPFHAPIPTPPAPAYPNAIYYASQNGAQEAGCSRSDDGGQTFGPAVQVYNLAQCGGGIHGHIKVSPQGTVYIPNSSCAVGSPVGVAGAAVSTTNGITWNSVAVPGSTGSSDPSIGIGQNNVGKPPGQVPNTVYMGWISGDGHAHAAHSPDEGATWQNDVDVASIFGIQKCVFPVMVAGDDNRAAYGFLGTDPDFPNKQVWHLYIANTYDGGQSWILVDLTPNDPVQIGNVCLLGIACTGGRNLLDFNDITVDAEGRILLGYTDGCLECANTDPRTQSTEAHGVVARQSGGRRLFSAFDPVEPGPPAAPQMVSALRISGPPSGVLVSWLEPDNGGSPITGYNIYRSTTSGAETFLASVSGNATTKYLDQTADSSTNYFYRVRAFNVINSATIEGGFCREVSVDSTGAAATTCASPYLQMGGPGIPGNITPDPSQGELTIQSVRIGEPFTSCNDNSVTLVMKVATLDPGNTGQPVLPPNAEWKFNFVVTTPDNVEHEMFVAMDTFAFNNASTASPNFSYGRRDPTPTGTSESMECFEQSASGVEVFHCPNLAEGTGPSAHPTASFTKDGTITIKLNFSVPLSFSAPQAPATGSAFTWDGSPVGTTLKHIRGSTILLAGIFLETVTTTGTFPETAAGCPTCPDYTRVGNVAGCNAIAPIAILSANPMTGEPPLQVDFDASASNEPAGACGGINSYTMDFGDGSAPVTQPSPLFSHVYTSNGEFAAKLIVGDNIGHVSSNQAQLIVSIEAPLDRVVSKKVHGGAAGGPFNIVLFDPVAFPNGAEIECRAPGPENDYTLVYTFGSNFTITGQASTVTIDGASTYVSSHALGPAANQYTVHLAANVPNAQRHVLTLGGLPVHNNSTNANNGFATLNAMATGFNLLVGDVNGDGFVLSGDYTSTRQKSGSPVDGNSFRFDVTADGFILSGDYTTVRQRSGTQLP